MAHDRGRRRRERPAPPARSARPRVRLHRRRRRPARKSGHGTRMPPAEPGEHGFGPRQTGGPAATRRRARPGRDGGCIRAAQRPRLRCAPRRRGGKLPSPGRWAAAASPDARCRCARRWRTRGGRVWRWRGAAVATPGRRLLQRPDPRCGWPQCMSGGGAIIPGAGVGMRLAPLPAEARAKQHRPPALPGGSDRTMVPPARLELATYALRMRRSTG